MGNNSILYEVIDSVLFPVQIDRLLDEAILIVDVMREENMKMYPACLKKIFPYENEEFWHLGSSLLNDFAFN